jgi:hypothetical protein
MDEHAVLVFHDQAFTDGEQIAFAQRLDGKLHAKTGRRVVAQNRFGNEALTDISNVGANGRSSPPMTAAANIRSATACGTRMLPSRIRPGATRCCTRA